MGPCDEYCVKILRYLDNALQGQELNDFRTHLESCAGCQASLEAERSLTHLLRRSRPLYSAPAVLRSRVSAAVMHYTESTSARIELCQSAPRLLERALVSPLRRVFGMRMLALVVLLLGFLLAFAPNIVRQVRAASYVEAAVTAHRGYLDGNHGLDLRSSSPERVKAWFTNKVPFHFRLPSPQAGPNETSTYRLTGAGVVNYRGSKAALVTYDGTSGKVSLLVASSDFAPVAGGDEVRLGNLTFHYRANDGFKVITWSNHGLAYALVSKVSGSARESCLVCHQNMTDPHAFRPGP